MARGVDIPNAFDAATDRANSFAALQRIWQEGCELPDAAEAIACRADALLAVLQYKLAGNRHPAPDWDGPGKAFAQALSRQWEVFGRAASRSRRGMCPIARRLPRRSTRMCRSARRKRSGSPPFRANSSRSSRARPGEVWDAPESPEQGQQLVEGLAQFIADADIQRLDAFLWQQNTPTTEIEAGCELTTVDLADERREIRLDCPGTEGFALEGYVQLQDDAAIGGAIARLQIDGHVLTNLKIAGGGYMFTRVGPTLLVLQLKERAAGLHARLPDGKAIRSLTIGSSDWRNDVVTATIADDFSMVRDAVATMRQQTADGASDALATAPMRRAALMPALFAALGADPIDWCCLDDTAMPAATLEP